MKQKYPFTVSEHAIEKYQERVKEDIYREQRLYPEIAEIISYSLVNSPFFRKNHCCKIHYLVNIRNPVGNQEYGSYYILVGQNKDNLGREVITIKNLEMRNHLINNSKREHPKSAATRRRYYLEQKPRDLERYLKD